VRGGVDTSPLKKKKGDKMLRSLDSFEGDDVKKRGQKEGSHYYETSTGL